LVAARLNVVGFSRLMERDEAATFAALKTLRAEVFEPTTRAHGGRIFKITGRTQWLNSTGILAAVAILSVARPKRKRLSPRSPYAPITKR
jgi:class 3 adenylate cyclase